MTPANARIATHDHRDDEAMREHRLQQFDIADAQIFEAALEGMAETPEKAPGGPASCFS